MTDKRPDPKPRRHPHLWQAYLIWNERMQMVKSHTLRLSSITKGKSNLDPEYEKRVITWAKEAEKHAKKEMCAYGAEIGPIWGWLTSIKGIGDHTAAKLLAQFDDVGKFDTVSKFWRFSGWAVIDGHIDRCKKGEKSPYNRRLKSECYLVAEQFVRQQTPLYAEIYYEEKERQSRLHPDPICSKCGAVARQKGKSWACPECSTSGGKIRFTPAHLHNRALRKTIKIFLQHFWVKWREFEGLPVSEPYAQAVMGHTHIVSPPGEKE